MFSTTTPNGNKSSHTAECCKPVLVTGGCAGLLVSEMKLKIACFWSVMLCSYVDRHQCLRRTWCRHLQGRIVPIIWKQHTCLTS